MEALSVGLLTRSTEPAYQPCGILSQSKFVIGLFRLRVCMTVRVGVLVERMSVCVSRKNRERWKVCVCIRMGAVRVVALVIGA